MRRHWRGVSTTLPFSLPTPELRGPLLEETRDSLLPVLRRVEGGSHPHFLGNGSRPTGVKAAIDQFFGHRDSQRGARGDGRGKRAGRVHQLARRSHLIDEAPATGPTGGDEVAAHDERVGGVATAEARQPLRAATTRHQSELAFGQTELRRLRGYNDVGDENEFEAAAQ